MSYWGNRPQSDVTLRRRHLHVGDGYRWYLRLGAEDDRGSTSSRISCMSIVITGAQPASIPFSRNCPISRLRRLADLSGMWMRYALSRGDRVSAWWPAVDRTWRRLRGAPARNCTTNLPRDDCLGTSFDQVERPVSSGGMRAISATSSAVAASVITAVANTRPRNLPAPS